MWCQLHQVLSVHSSDVSGASTAERWSAIKNNVYFETEPEKFAEGFFAARIGIRNPKQQSTIALWFAVGCASCLGEVHLPIDTAHIFTENRSSSSTPSASMKQHRLEVPTGCLHPLPNKRDNGNYFSLSPVLVRLPVKGKEKAKENLRHLLPRKGPRSK